MSFTDVLKRLHLYLFLFLSGEIGYGGQTATAAQSSIWRVLVLLSVAYGIVFFFRFPTHLRITTVLYLLLTVWLIGVSYHMYGVPVASMQYMGLSLSFTLVYGGYVACWYLREISLREIGMTIFGLFFINQVVLGRIMLHQFNATERSTTAEETYYLLLPFCYYAVRYLQTIRLRHLITALLVLVMLIGFFHRTVWMAATAAIGVLSMLMHTSIRQHLGLTGIRLLPYLGLGIMAVLAFLMTHSQTAARLSGSLSESFSDIGNANSQGTSGWRHEQRQLYWNRIVQRPLLGWSYEGYEDGELIIDDPESPDTKGTFIHSGYVNALYHYGLFGLSIHYGLLLSTLAFMWRRFRREAGYIALFVFLTTGLVYSWSYQLPLFYWVLLGVGSYMASLIPVRRVQLPQVTVVTPDSIRTCS